MKTDSLKKPEARVAARVEEYGITQAAIAAKTGFGAQKVSNQLTGKQPMSAEDLEEYCIALKMDPRDVLKVPVFTKEVTNAVPE